MAKKARKIADNTDTTTQSTPDAADNAAAGKLAAFAAGDDPKPRPAPEPTDPTRPAPPPVKEPSGYDVPRKPARARAHSLAAPETGDKAENLAKAFHDREDGVADEIHRSTATSERDAAMNGHPRVPEEDRRRAILSKEIGVDLFKRENAGQRPDEPTLLEANQMYFKQEDARRHRQAELQEAVGDTLIEAFGPRGGKRITKNLR